MSADVRDILELERPPTPELTKEALWSKQKRSINEMQVSVNCKISFFHLFLIAIQFDVVDAERVQNR